MSYDEMIEKIRELHPNVFDDYLEAVREELFRFDQSLLLRLKRYLETGEIQDYVFNDFSIYRLVDDYSLNPVAAYIAIHRMKDDYEKVMQQLDQGFDFTDEWPA